MTFLEGAPPGSAEVVRGPSGFLEPGVWPVGHGSSLDRAKAGTEDRSLPLSICVLDGILDSAEDPAAVLALTYETMRPGGRLVITVPGRRRPRSTRKSNATKEPSFPRDSLQCLLFQEGFTEISQTRFGTHRLLTAYRSSQPPARERDLRLSVIVPAYNERATFKKTMELLLDKQIPGFEVEVIVVESNSSDGTRQEAVEYAAAGIQVILEERPEGKGHAVRSGLAAATGDVVLIQDADLEYDIDDYDILLDPIRQFQASFVMGKRKAYHDSWGLRRFGDARLTSHFMNVGHIFFMVLFNLTYGQRLHDPFTMYKVFRRDCLSGLVLRSDRFDFDWELLAKLIRSGYTPIEIPVQYRSRSFQEGKKVSLVRDPISWVVACFRFRFERLHPGNGLPGWHADLLTSAEPARDVVRKA